ncbi:hypothetical protein, conserved [Angomonas deanei]|uniref:Uncharacterized protein n=1 Tax=Angomonas deanei TaxID=59799 RepID=A0A7G2CG33_9TRYP|nr:hypothetical protein, conserved [Angomonas deanei]
MRLASRRISVPLCWARPVSGGVGRGDLYYYNHLSTTKGSRVQTTQLGLRNNSQATFPQTGQLHIQKQILHARPSSKASTNAFSVPERTRWSYLIPSLFANIEKSLPTPLFDKYEAAQKLGDSSTLTEEEVLAIREAYRLFRYELARRLPLLEDGIAQAEVRHLMLWPGLFRRAGVKLPLEDVRDHHVALIPSKLLSSNSADTIPVEEAASFDQRLMVLTTNVRQCVEQELKTAPLDSSSPRRKRSSEQLSKEWTANWEWHSHQ